MAFDHPHLCYIQTGLMNSSQLHNGHPELGVVGLLLGELLLLLQLVRRCCKAVARRAGKHLLAFLRSLQ